MAIKSIDYTKCSGCGICTKTCPVDVFREVGKVVYIAYPEDCMVCHLCAMHCPEDSIHITPERSVEIPLPY